MSWLFGIRRNDTSLPGDDLTPESPGGSGAITPPPSEAGGGGDRVSMSDKSRKAMEAYRFDSSALERAAQAARELERSSKYIFSTINSILIQNLKVLTFHVVLFFYNYLHFIF